MKRILQRGAITVVFALLVTGMSGSFVFAAGETEGGKGKAKAEKQEKAPLTPVEQELASLRAFYRKAEDFTARFRQNYHSRVTRRVTESEGRVDFAKPMKMRWDYEKPEKKSYLSDGKELWVIDWEAKLAKRYASIKASELESSLAFLWGGGDLQRDYTVTVLPVTQDKLENTIPVSGRVVLELIPRTKTGFEVLYLLVDPQSGRIEETLLVDTLGNLNHIVFLELKSKQRFDDARFRFKKPDESWVQEDFAF